MAQPSQFCALNVALYGGGAPRWAFTERGKSALECSLTSLTIGPNALAWDGTALVIAIDELTAPWRTRIRGGVRLYPSALSNTSVLLDAEGRHRWSPIAPCASVEVDFECPSLTWAGSGYFDANHGNAPLEHAFHGWTWSRARTRSGTTVLYDVERRDGHAVSLALEFDPSGTVRSFEPPPVAQLRGTRWRIPRSIRSDVDYAPQVMRTLEDTPFYARSLVASSVHNERITSMHESLSLDRFGAEWVRRLLPLRMRRVRE
jgi:carotenoid 1,2-hydratase